MAGGIQMDINLTKQTERRDYKKLMSACISPDKTGLSAAESRHPEVMGKKSIAETIFFTLIICYFFSYKIF